MNKNELILIIENLLKNKKRRKLHISLNNGIFYNGIIVDYKDENLLNFNDNKLGHIGILFSHIVKIEPMVER